MLNELTASAVNAGALFSNSRFEVPLYQREYSWTLDEIKEFWADLQHAKQSESESYFLGLVILTENNGIYQVVDGQQRMLTLTLLVVALRDEAKKSGREALAEKLQSDFLTAINYKTDVMEQRVTLSGELDSTTLDRVIAGNIDQNLPEEDLSRRLLIAFDNLKQWLRTDVSRDPFKKLGEWAEFITGRLYFAVFTHPDKASAYRVFEAINTRGRSLTTADLLKNFLLSQVGHGEQKNAYERWQRVSQQFDSDSGVSYVQYIRHVVTVRAGYILPKELYDYLARRGSFKAADPPPPLDLLKELEDRLPLYSQMIDPTIGGPADEEMLKVYRAFNQLSVITVRPILLALFDLPNSLEASKALLRLVVRRIVVGNLGTGSVERRFGEAAKDLFRNKDWDRVWRSFVELNPAQDDFSSQLSRRSFNKTVLAFLRKSVVAGTITPVENGALHLIRVKSSDAWGGFDDDELSYWINTIGNTLLTRGERRSKDAVDWPAFKRTMLPDAVDGEFIDELCLRDVWNANSVEEEGRRIANLASAVWYV
jgi:hypothetical protein